MATIYNSQLTRELTDAAKIQVSRDKIPNQLAEKVVPVMEVNPKLLRRANIVRSGTATGTGASTIYTTPSNQDFFLTHAELSIIKDAASDYATGGYPLNVTIDGVTRSILIISILTLTAQNQTVGIAFNTPVKLDRGSTIALNSASSTAGTFIRAATFGGFVDEQSLA